MFLLFRSILYFVLLVLSTIFFSLLLMTAGLLLPYKQRSQIANAWGICNLKLLSGVCGLNYEIEGMENLSAAPCIVLSKHQSSWETISLRGLLPPCQAWVLKRELLWIPIFGWALATVKPIGINRKAGRHALKQVIEVGIERLKKGHNVIIFPEGTRVAPGERKRYGFGGAMLAHHSGYPVVPIAHNAGVFWRRRGLKKYPGTIRVVIGEPIKTQGLQASEINQRVEEWIESTVERLPNSI